MTGAKIYDYDPFDKPDQQNYYQLRETGKFQTRPVPQSPTNLAVSVEHILEWQVLVEFIRSDVDRCVHLAKFFNEPVDIDTTLNVVSGGVSTPENVKTTETGIEWVAHQYPGNKGSGSKFAYEFVSLHDSVNGRKERVRKPRNPYKNRRINIDKTQLWSEGKENTKKAKGPNAQPVKGKKADMIDADKWKKWTKEKKWQPPATAQTPAQTPGQTTGTKRKKKNGPWTLATNNEDKCSAVVALRDVIGVYRYHTYPEIQTILTAQIDRIGTAFNYLETGPLASKQYPNPNGQGTFGYTAMATPLQDQWKAYLKEKYASVIEDIEDTMKTHAADLEAAKVKRGWLEYLGKRAVGPAGGPLCGAEPDKTKMNARITMLLKEYEAVKKNKWVNPMP
jgi:hypothetical protein